MSIDLANLSTTLTAMLLGYSLTEFLTISLPSFMETVNKLVLFPILTMLLPISQKLDLSVRRRGKSSILAPLRNTVLIPLHQLCLKPSVAQYRQFTYQTALERLNTRIVRTTKLSAYSATKPQQPLKKVSKSLLSGHARKARKISNT